MWLDVNYAKKPVKNTNTWRLNNTLLNYQEITEEIKKIPRNKWQWKHNDPKPMGCSKSSSKREVYSNTILPRETRNISNKKPNLTAKAIRERRKKKSPKLAEGKKS